MANIAPTRSVVFIHGMFMTPTCWDAWQARFQSQGWKTQAPAWPEHDLPIERQRQAGKGGALSALTLEQVVDRYAQLIQAMPEPPILVGHSMGGLVVQLLLQRGLGAAGIAIDSAPPKGVISLKWSFLKSNWPVISPSAKIDLPIAMSLEDFHYAFAHTLPLDEVRAVYDTQVVPESRRVGKGPTTAGAKVDFSHARAPLLFIAGGDDHIIPASLNRSNYKRYDARAGVTDFREFPGRTHYTLGQKGWEEVADYALSWIATNQK
jgi:pimeloyl-ACP methyl ester carboxylesterase